MGDHMDVFRETEDISSSVLNSKNEIEDLLDNFFEQIKGMSDILKSLSKIGKMSLKKKRYGEIKNVLSTLIKVMERLLQLSKEAKQNLKFLSIIEER